MNNNSKSTNQPKPESDDLLVARICAMINEEPSLQHLLGVTSRKPTQKGTKPKKAQ